MRMPALPKSKGNQKKMQQSFWKLVRKKVSNKIKKRSFVRIPPRD